MGYELLIGKMVLGISVIGLLIFVGILIYGFYGMKRKVKGK